MTFYRHYALREGVGNSLVMIQPALDAYQLDRLWFEAWFYILICSEEPIPVLLTTASVTADRILVLDTFFHLIIFSGKTIAAWRVAGYHEQEGYENLKKLFEAPLNDVKEILATRYPSPMYIECDFNGSQARFLLAVLDPDDGRRFLSNNLSHCRWSRWTTSWCGWQHGRGGFAVRGCFSQGIHGPFEEKSSFFRIVVVGERTNSVFFLQIYLFFESAEFH